MTAHALTHVSLFTGIGGLDLAAEAAGFETVLQVEREPYALRVLEKHWPNVPRITDVREVTLERVQEIMADAEKLRWGNKRISGNMEGASKEKTERRHQFAHAINNSSSFITSRYGGYCEDENEIRPNITVVSGGFPCQPFSAAGKRRGADDDRYLWPELLRIVEELRPSWVIGENVSGLLSIDDGMEIDRMLVALEARDYAVRVLHYPAAGVGAPHKRDRVFIVANCKGKRNNEQGYEQFQPREIQVQARRGNSDVADANTTRLQRRQETRDACGIGTRGDEHVERCGYDTQSAWSTESRLGPVADGFSSWLDEPDGVPRVATGVKDRAARLKALGNAVVPAQAYPIFAAIAEVEQ